MHMREREKKKTKEIGGREILPQIRRWLYTKENKDGSEYI